MLNNNLECFFYTETTCVNENEIVEKCVSTTDEATCKEWFEERRLRISASNAARKIKTRRANFEPLACDLLKENVLLGKAVENVEYGTENESHASREYEELFNVSAIKCGLIIHKYQPWLCASPDTLIVENGKISKVLEVKCPVSCGNKPVIDPNSNINIIISSY